MKLRSGRVLRKSPKQFMKEKKSPKIYPTETEMENEVVKNNHRMRLRPRK